MDPPLASIVHEALGLELSSQGRHLLAEQPLPDRLDGIADEGQAALSLVDVEVAREHDLEAVAQLHP